MDESQRAPLSVVGVLVLGAVSIVAVRGSAEAAVIAAVIGVLLLVSLTVTPGRPSGAQGGGPTYGPGNGGIPAPPGR